MKKMIAAFVLFLGLAACGPVIETHYDFTPPRTNAGMKCVANCQDQQGMCQSDATRYREQCRHDAERKAEREYRRKQDEYVMKLKLHAKDPEKFKEPKEPYRSSPNYWECDNAGGDCVGGYHMCYRSCGGQISERQVCVQNCDQQ